VPASPSTPGAEAAPASATTAAGTLPTGSPQEQYNYAFGLLRRANYPAAEQALRSFVKRYPNNTLAGNAQYWLGETFYARKDYNDAAIAFAEGYEKYPKSGKAADNLLKLGMSLSNLGHKTDACRAFARLDRDFPAAPANIKERAASEKKRAGC
jgi:tol-pal system protein YbgF